jgi:hypothetical protein
MPLRRATDACQVSSVELDCAATRCVSDHSVYSGRATWTTLMRAFVQSIERSAAHASSARISSSVRGAGAPPLRTTCRPNRLQPGLPGQWQPRCPALLLDIPEDPENLPASGLRHAGQLLRCSASRRYHPSAHTSDKRARSKVAAAHIPWWLESPSRGEAVGLMKEGKITV